MHSSLIGHKGSTRERLQMDTNSYINIPRRYEEGPICKYFSIVLRNNSTILSINTMLVQSTVSEF